jgi:hypothetical protein
MIKLLFHGWGITASMIAGGCRRRVHTTIKGCLRSNHCQNASNTYRLTTSLRRVAKRLEERRCWRYGPVRDKRSA